MDSETRIYNMDTELHEGYAPWKRYASPFFFTTAQRDALAQMDAEKAAKPAPSIPNGTASPSA